jgi:hypothetical protein
MHYVLRASAAIAALSFCLIAPAADLTATFKKGKAELKSAGPLAFGPEGILFAGDTLGAAIFAFDTGDRGPREKSGARELKAVDGQVAALLGTTPREVQIQDLAVNPASGGIYLSVARGRGPKAEPAIIRVNAEGKLALLDLDAIGFLKAELPDAPGPAAVERGNESLRLESITDLAYAGGRVLVAGLSNEEFASTLRSIPFPFEGNLKGTSVEIYHGAHGRFETRSPVRTFVPYEIAGEPHLLAAYTCTPLVKFPLKELKPGVHLKGTTIAELGNRNRPLDMIAYKKEGKDFLLLANNNRGIMRIAAEALEGAGPIETHVRQGTKGVPYETIEGWKGIEQLDRLDDKHALVLRREEDGALRLETLPLP